MKKLLVIILISFYFTSCSENKDIVLEDCKESIKTKLKDPDSLQLGEYKKSEENGVITIKGEYRAKNSFGGYSVGTFSCLRGGDETFSYLYE